MVIQCSLKEHAWYTATDWEAIDNSPNAVHFKKDTKSEWAHYLVMELISEPGAHCHGPEIRQRNQLALRQL